MKRLPLSSLRGARRFGERRRRRSPARAHPPSGRILASACTPPTYRAPGRSPWATGGRSSSARATQAAVYALRDEDANGGRRAAGNRPGSEQPNGVAFRDGSLYVAEVSRVLRYDGIEARLASPPRPVVVNDSFPTRRPPRLEVHRVRPRRAPVRPGRRAVQRLRAAPTPVTPPSRACVRTARGLEIFASGVRNTVGFDWHPSTGELWFTDNGRDMLGDDFPPDELNRAPRAGLHFGFPYRHGDDHAGPGVRGSGAGRRTSLPPARSSAPTSRRWACASTPAPCSPRSTATGSSSPSTVRGTAASPIRLPRDARTPPTVIARSPTSPSRRAGCRGRRPGAGRWTCW